MALIDPNTWLEHLSPAECWRLVALTPVGRIGVLHDSAPEIYPVNHAVDEGAVVFRTDPGSKWRGLLRSPAVCFEVDGLDAEHETGWSVLIKGRAVEVRDPDEIRRLDELGLRNWVLSERRHWVRIVPEVVTGRRIWNRVTGLAPSSSHYIP
jgi:nitroimidazol reductase NimA-like FMN-containing flavoprotein (pyridoxamine 5'-phosphate oxidase superfamily)